VSSHLPTKRRALVALGGAGPIPGQYLWPATASRGASWPLPRVRTALLPIVLRKLRRVRFPSSALDFVAVAPISIFAGPIRHLRGRANGVRSGSRSRRPGPRCWRGSRGLEPQSHGDAGMTKHHRDDTRKLIRSQRAVRRGAGGSVSLEHVQPVSTLPTKSRMAFASWSGASMAA
jgi:hypothetical protein